MRTRRTHTSLAHLFLVLAPVLICTPAHAQATPARINIGAQPLAQALNALARASGLQLIAPASLLAGKNSPAVSGRLSTRDTLDRLLTGSGLSARIDGNTIVVKLAADAGAARPATLPTLTVDAQAGADGTVGYVATRSRSALKTDTPLVETAQSVSVVTKEQLEDQKPRSVPQALNYTPGVFTGLVGSSNRYDYVALRGFRDASVDSTLLDGLRLLSDQGSYSSMQVDPYFLERIDVVRGPASVTFGRASPGGIVALASSRPQAQAFREVQVTVGSHDRVEGAVDLSGPIDEQGILAFRLTALARKMDSQFDHVKEERRALAPSLAINFTPRTQLLLQAYLQDDPEGSYHSGVPMDASITAGHNGSRISRNFFDGDPSVEKYRRIQRFVGYQFEHAFNDEWKFRQNLRRVSADTTLHQIYGYGWDGPTTLTRYYAGARESTSGITADNQLEGRFATGTLRHTLLVGVDYQKRETRGDWSSGSAHPIDVLSPSYGAPGLSGVTSAPIDRKMEGTGLYLQDQMALGNWRLALGGRQDWANASNRYGDGPAARSNESQFSKRAGLVYLFDNGLAPYLSYSDGFNPSLRAGRNGELLAPALARQSELGLRYQPSGSSTLLSAAVYDLEQKNVASRPVGANYFEPAGKVRSRGLELELRSQFGRSVSLLASYSFVDMKYLESPAGFAGNTPYQAPRHLGSVWGDWNFAPGYTAGAGVRYVGSSWGDDENTFKVPSSIVADLMLRLDLGKISASMRGAHLRFAVNNLFDRTFVASCMNRSYCYWGDERSMTATFGYAW